MGKSKYFFSIGQRFKRVPHPALDITPDDLVVVEAESEREARVAFIEALRSVAPEADVMWSHSYPESDDLTAFPGRRVPLAEALRK